MPLPRNPLGQPAQQPPREPVRQYTEEPQPRVVPAFPPRQEERAAPQRSLQFPPFPAEEDEVEYEGEYDDATETVPSIDDESYDESWGDEEELAPVEVVQHHLDAPRQPAPARQPVAVLAPEPAHAPAPVNVFDEAPAVPVVETPARQASQAHLSRQVMESVQMLMSIIADEESTEVLMNGPNEIMFKKGGARYHVPGIMFNDAATYHHVINEYVLPLTDTEGRITGDSYLVEGQLELEDQPGQPPLLARVHVIAPPVVTYAKVTIAKKARHSYDLDAIAGKGAMTREMAEFLKAAAYGRLTTIFSGLSGAGKTTMLEACSHEFDQNDRIIVVEDTPELRLPIADVVYMTTSSVKPGTDIASTVSMEWLVRATNRMRPDRIIVGEVRGGEMGEFLIAANSGADGSMTTIHASDPRRTLDKILGLAMRAEGAKNEMSVRRDIASTVQLIVQIILVDGKHIVSHIEEVSSTIRQDTGMIATTTLFEYDRSLGRHIARNRPSETMQAFLAQRGVEIQNTWFR